MSNDFPSDDNDVSLDVLRAVLGEEQSALTIPDRPNDDGYRLLDTFLRELKRIEGDATKIYEQRFIESATGTELERLGANVGVDRRSGESKSKYRRRALAGYIVATSTGVYEDVGDAALTLLDADASQVFLRRAGDTGDPATAVLEIDQQAIDDSPFTKSELADELTDVVPGGHRLTVQSRNVATWGDSSRGWGTQFGSPTS